MKSLFHNLPALLFPIVILASCNPGEEYPVEPQISFTSIVSRDSVDELDNTIKKVILTFHLTDGDGDIGLAKNDTTGPFHKDSTYYYNLFIQEYEKVDNEFVAVSESGGLKRYRIPDISPSGQNKTLIADISVSLEYHYSESNPLPYSEFRYQFYLVDRDLNVSNTDTTDIVVW